MTEVVVVAVWARAVWGLDLLYQTLLWFEALPVKLSK